MSPTPSHHRFLSNHELAASMATLWSMTHSPMPRYESTHFLSSLLSEILSEFTLGLAARATGER